MPETSPAVAAAIEGELRLLDPVVRASAELLASLLHPEFREIGTSGRLWTREAIIASLTADDAASPGPLTASRMRGRSSPPTWCTSPSTRSPGASTRTAAPCGG